MDKRTPILRGEVLGADNTWVAFAAFRNFFFELVSSAYCPKCDQLYVRRLRSSVLRDDVGHQSSAMEALTAARGGRAQGAGEVHSAICASPRGGIRISGRLMPTVNVTKGGE